MTPGRKPRPAALRRLEGNPGHRPIPDTPSPVLGHLPAPAFLGDIALETWHRVVSEMQAIGTLGVENARALERYCVLYARWRAAEAHVAEHGVVVAAPRTGVPMPNPHLSIANAAGDRLAKLEAEFGLTPSSRSRLKAGPRDAVSSPIDEFLQ